MAIPPRRARLKKCQSEVKGLSFTEQKMIEKALKESLKENYRRDSSSSEDSDNSDSTASSSPIQTTSNRFTRYRSEKLKCNIAKKSASKTPVKLSKHSKPVKVRKLGTEDPVYQPCLSTSSASLPPKRSIERNSKAITNIKLDLSFESDECSVTSSSSSETTSSSSYTDDSEHDHNDVIVINSSSDDSSSIDSYCGHYVEGKPPISKSIEHNLFKENSQKTKQSNEKLCNLPTYPGLLASAVKKRPIKTQKILFKAVKKSSLLVPMPSKLQSKKRPCSPQMLEQTIVKIEPSVKKRPLEPSQIIHNHCSSDDDEQESWSSVVSDSDECSSALRSSKDSDKSFYQAQRKFAAYSGQSNQSSNGEPSAMIDTGVAHSIPSTEDFLLFLCLRSSGKVPESLQIFNTPWTSSHQS